MKYVKQFEHYHPGKEVSIREATKEEVKYFVDNAESGEESDYNLLHMFDDIENPIGAFMDDKMIGGLSFGNHPRIDDTTLIDVIFVDQNHKKEGVGKLFMYYIKDNTDNPRIVANPYTNKAQTYFEKLGFKLDEDIDPSDTNSVVIDKEKI